MKTDIELGELLKMKDRLIGGQLCKLHGNGSAGLYGEILEIVSQHDNILINIKVKGKGEHPYYLPLRYSLSLIRLGPNEMLIAWSWCENDKEKFILTPKPQA